MDWVTIIGYALAPVTGIVTWIAARTKQRNDFLKEMQESINVIITENKNLYKELLDLRKELYERDKRIFELQKQLLSK